jgi:tRNA(fMet)-specific endonuclease VapC
MAAVASATNGEERIRFYSRLARSLETLGSLNLVAYDESAEKRFMDLKGLKLRLGTQDLKIASIALANSLIVVTRNRRDFGRIPGLTIEDWSAP